MSFSRGAPFHKRYLEGKQYEFYRGRFFFGKDGEQIAELELSFVGGGENFVNIRILLQNIRWALSFSVDLFVGTRLSLTFLRAFFFSG